MNDSSAEAIATVRARIDGRLPKVAVILGSGLAGFAEALEDRLVIANRDLPGFPHPSVTGHAGDLVFGALGGCQVAVMTGRTHFYETGRADGMKTPLSALRALGCEILILTNAAGSLRPDAGPGCLMLITDHINLSGTNPLIGPGDDTRFVDLIDCYDPELRERALQSAAAQGVELHQGVYMWFSGPSFETPAEIRMAKLLGADVVGMSTVPEAIVARQLGFRVLAVSAITNMAAGLDDQPLDHGQTVAKAAKALDGMTRLLTALLRGLGQTP